MNRVDARVAAIVGTEGLGRGLYRLVDQLRASTVQLEIVLIDDGSADDVTRRALDSVPRDGRVVRVEVTRGASPGAWRNAGIAATEAELAFCVDPGWRPEAAWAERAGAALGAHSGAAIATSAFRRIGPTGVDVLLEPRGNDLAALLGDPGCFHPCSVFSRTLWKELGGFDEELAGLELADFWMRALSGGASAIVLDEPHVVHEAGRTRHFRKALDRRSHVPMLTTLYRKHQARFDANPAAVLTASEAALYELSEVHPRIKDRRARAVAEHDALRSEIRELKAVLSANGETPVDWGDLRRTSPISPEWGSDRGKPVDRQYIETFLGEHSADVRGAVLEVQEDDYTRTFGSVAVEHSDVVDLDPTNPRATFVADLRRMESVPSGSYDCFILTQTVHVIDDMRRVIEQAHRILKPGGVLLATFPCLSRVCLEYGEDGDFWRLTEAGVRNLLEGVFAPERVETTGYGNVLTATAFLYGLACEELTDAEFAAYDPYYPMLIGARAVKADEQRERGAPAVHRSAVSHAGTVLAYHRVAVGDGDTHGLCVAPDTFREQMRHLREHRHPMPLGELVTRARAGDLPPGAVAVTFDDGYVDALEVASPILLELGIPATFFLVVEGLERELMFWWDALERIFLGSAQLPGALDLRIGGSQHARATSTRDERRAAHDALYHDLLRCPPAQRDAVLRGLAAWSGVSLAPDGVGRPMLAAEARELASRAGHAIGAHGVHHLALSQQPYETQQREIMESKTALEALLGKPVTAFAYPYGDVCDTAVTLVATAGFEVAVTCEPKPVDLRVQALRVPRLTSLHGAPGWPQR